MTIADLKKAREKLKANDPDTGLPGREDKIADLQNFLIERLKIRQTAAEKRARMESGQVAYIKDLHNNKTVFVCGVPGTGKTAVVMKVVDDLHKQLKSKNCNLHKFQYLYINAQHLSQPNKVYSEILFGIAKVQYPPDKAQEYLEKIITTNEPTKFNKQPARSAKKVATKSATLDKDMHYVIIIDELDMLYSEKRQNVFYSLFDWPTSSSSRIVLITIANAMDLPEKFMRRRIESRLGWNKIIFEPYTSDHLAGILKAKLGQSLMDKCFDKNAVIIATKRIGKTTGDARRIIDTCCLAVDEAIQENVPKVTSAIVDRVGFQNLDRMKVDYVKTCPPLELITLKSILNESKGQGEENIFALGVFKQVENMVKQSKQEWLRDRVMSYDEFHELLNTLQAVGLIAVDDQKTLFEKRLFIKDTSESFRDVIRLTALPQMDLKPYCSNKP